MGEEGDPECSPRCGNIERRARSVSDRCSGLRIDGAFAGDGEALSTELMMLVASSSSSRSRAELSDEASGVKFIFTSVGRSDEDRAETWGE